MSTTVDLGKITASVTVGTTTTGAAGTNASVSNSGTTQDAVLNFTIPRGAQGVQGPQGSTGPQGPAGPTGPQGPMGDVAVITPEQQAAFTMYSEPGQNTNGPMTQKAVTDNLVAGSISYDNSQSGLSAENVQGALDEVDVKTNTFTGNVADLANRSLFYMNNAATYSTVILRKDGFFVRRKKTNKGSVIQGITLPTLTVGKKYKISFDYTSYFTGAYISIRDNSSSHANVLVLVNSTTELSGHRSEEFEYSSDFAYLCANMQAGSKVYESLSIANLIIEESSNVEDAIDEVNNDLHTELDVAFGADTVLDLENYQTGFGYPSAASGTPWLVDYLTRTHKVIERGALGRIKVTAPSGNAARFCFVKSYTTPISGASVNFCTGYESIYNVAAGETSGWVNIPEDCRYIIIITQNTSTDYYPQSVEVSSMVFDIVPVYQSAIPTTLLSINDWEQGTMDTSTGNVSTTPSSIRIRTNKYFCISPNDTVAFASTSQKFRICYYDKNCSYISYTDWHSGDVWSVPSNVYYIRLYGAWSADSNVYISPSDYSASITITRKSVVKEIADNNGIIFLNKEMKSIVPTVARPPRNGNVVQGDVLTLLHFSDLHLDRSDELCRLIEFKNCFSDYIDDIISTGDLQDSGFESGITNFTNTDGAEEILQVIGNHDCYINPTNGNWKLKPKADVYARFFTPFVSNWGVTQPSNAAANALMYWYKDYTAQGIRLIGLDCLYPTDAEATWLASTLADAKTNSLAVVCAVHYRTNLTNIVCNMDDLTYQPQALTDNFTLDSRLVTAVKNFIDADGEFICWLCGHEHKDYVGTATDDPNQLFIGIALAQCGARASYGVMDRVNCTKSQDLFNVVSFDTYNKNIRILRVGADFDCFMRSKKSLCINYETHQVIGQS